MIWKLLGLRKVRLEIVDFWFNGDR
jgi:hypothetical protein